MNPATVRRAYLACCAVAALMSGFARPTSLPADEPTATRNGRQVLVMQSGRTLKGSVSRSPNGYVVEHAAGRLVVPFDEVRVVGDSLPDAYRRLRESFTEPTAATHYDLARWCWTHHLPDEARSELIMALDRDPDHDAARDLLERIDEHVAQSRKKSAPADSRLVAGMEVPEVESLAGLSRETAARYTSRVQPLLMNKCGNASCHGTNSSQSLRLESVRGTGAGHRIHSERNLAALLEYIDVERPERSALLTALDGNHGGLNRSLFYGPSGERQVKLLKDWIHAAAKEKRNAGRQRDRQPSVLTKETPLSDPGVVPAAATASESRSNADRKNRRPSTTSTKPGDRDDGTEFAIAINRGDSQNESLRDETAAADSSPTSDEKKPDAFDPEAFNRRYHGGRDDKAGKRPKREREAEP
jgi:hypothetical protein